MVVIEPPETWSGEPAASTKYHPKGKLHLSYHIMKGSNLLCFSTQTFTEHSANRDAFLLIKIWTNEAYKLYFTRA